MNTTTTADPRMAAATNPGIHAFLLPATERVSPPHTSGLAGPTACASLVSPPVLLDVSHDSLDREGPGRGPDGNMPLCPGLVARDNQGSKPAGLLTSQDPSGSAPSPPCATHSGPLPQDGKSVVPPPHEPISEQNAQILNTASNLGHSRVTIDLDNAGQFPPLSGRTKSSKFKNVLTRPSNAMVEKLLALAQDETCDDDSLLRAIAEATPYKQKVGKATFWVETAPWG
ncbi:hypothetical protein H257_13225 [Aphanomyces astaci]|uniref:Uncharacterized protein n=1 Tax=Aphanomyces astaci TaxID=112090 RepID=W4FVN1_APHAT|nr:hypothetical protein H257_13225 [Aphanomyces astaci]ETV71560.1 hypothetical protein H257_13225 [Aphanomyces astaci]|eukprot:XP_009838993.1 hypothetical protein H257_13225 [Aphanomyces astaci]